MQQRNDVLISCELIAGRIRSAARKDSRIDEVIDTPAQGTTSRIKDAKL